MSVFTQILDPYFNWLEELFGKLANEARKHNVDPGEIAKDYLSIPKRKDSFYSNGMDYVCDQIINYWSHSAPLINEALAATPGMKGRFGGDLGPQLHNQVFERTGLYFDTLIVPDPLLRVASMPSDAFKTKDYLLIKYGITQLLLKNVYFADVFPPIAVLVPEPELLAKTDHFSKLSDQAMIDTVVLVNDMFGREFDSFNETKDFFASLKTPTSAIRELKKPEKFFWDEDIELKASLQLDALTEGTYRDFDLKELPTSAQGASFLLFTLHSRMMQINDLWHKCNLQGAHPIVSAPVSYHWLTYKLNEGQKLFAQHLELDQSLNLRLTNALLSQQLDWLGNLTLEQLIELRKKGYLRELRAVVSAGLDSLSRANLDNIDLITNQVDLNLSTELQKHQNELQDLQKSMKFDLAVSVPSLLLSITAAIQPSIAPLAPDWALALGGVVGATSLKSIVSSTIKYLQEHRRLGRTPAGILWKAKKK